MRPPRRLQTVLLLLLVLAGLAPAAVGPSSSQGGPALELIGEIIWPTDHRFEEILVGGLSAITCPSDGGSCYAISDDRAERGPVRVFELEIDLEDGELAPGDVRVVGAIDLLDEGGRNFEPSRVDPEGLALAPDGTLWAVSEGITSERVDPWIRQFTLRGEPLRSLEVPADYSPAAASGRGVYDNLGFESLAVAPDGRTLFTASENALAQDGPRTAVGIGSPARLLAYDLATGEVAGEYLYWVDSIPYSPIPAGRLATQGINELLALDSETLVALERGFVFGVGNRIRLYEIDLAGADDLSTHLVGGRLEEPTAIRPVSKRLLLDLDQLRIPLDNLEGMSFGPRLPDGRRSLLLIGDNNFNPRQVTQLLAFAVRHDALQPATPATGLDVPSIQGSGHLSPWLGRRVAGIPGVVTAILDDRGSGGFWMQDPAGDGDPSTSDGIFVATAPESPPVTVGDRVQVDGRVEERSREHELSVTLIAADRVKVTAGGDPLPEAVRFGTSGRVIPPRLSGEVEERNPEAATIDLFESLEGMRVEVPAPVVVGPTSRYGEIAVAADRGAGLGQRTAAGGVLRTATQVNLQRLVVAASLVAAPEAQVGAEIEASIHGILTYAFGSYRIEATAPVVAPEIVESGPSTHLNGGPNRLTVATYNVENLSQTGSATRFGHLARQIVDRLRAPDILALQEIQDDSGSADDGVVTAQRTLTRLIETIAAAGGPTYDHLQIDPQDGTDGGRPGGNIRVALLFNPSRVGLARRGEAGTWDATAVEGRGPATRLTLNPGRVAPTHPAFNASRQPHLSGSRKPLAAKLEFAGRSLFVINNHFNSKSGDDRLMGSHQPPLPLTEAQRRDQAAVVHLFVDQLLAADPDARVIVLGDLNDFEFSRPLEILASARLLNLVAETPVAERYSHIYRGNSGAIDHILVSEALLREVRPEIDIVHLNVDRPATRRASDHDPVVARFSFAD